MQKKHCAVGLSFVILSHRYRPVRCSAVKLVEGECLGESERFEQLILGRYHGVVEVFLGIDPLFWGRGNESCSITDGGGLGLLDYRWSHISQISASKALFTLLTGSMVKESVESPVIVVLPQVHFIKETPL